jgi:hypothetical protein
MTESEWLTATDPRAMRGFLLDCGRASERKLRVFACAGVRRGWSLLTDERSRFGVEVRERYEDGLATAEELSRAMEAAAHARAEARAPYRLAATAVDERAPEVGPVWMAGAASTAAYGNWGGIDMAARGVACVAPIPWEDAYAAERTAQAALLRDIFGPLPFREVPIDPAWLACNGTVRRLAEVAYNERQLPAGTLDVARLAVLADALEEAGCDDAGLLGHLRSPGPHVRGCAVIDALLGKS